MAALVRLAPARQRRRHDAAARQIDLAFDLRVIESEAAFRLEALIEHQFARDPDAVGKEGGPALHLDLARPQPHLVAEPGGREPDEPMDLRAPHEPSAADKGPVGADGEIAAALELAFREGDLSVDLSARETDAALDLGAAHDPVAADLHHVGLDRAPAAVDLDVARAEALADPGACQRDAARELGPGDGNALLDDQAGGRHRPVLAGPRDLGAAGGELATDARAAEENAAGDFGPVKHEIAADRGAAAVERLDAAGDVRVLRVDGFDAHAAQAHAAFNCDAAQHPRAIAGRAVGVDGDAAVLELAVLPQHAAADARTRETDLSIDDGAAQDPRTTQAKTVGEERGAARVVDVRLVHRQRLADGSATQAHHAADRAAGQKEGRLEVRPIGLDRAGDLALVKSDPLQARIAQVERRVLARKRLEVAMQKDQGLVDRAALEIEAPFDDRVVEAYAHRRHAPLRARIDRQIPQDCGADGLTVQLGATSRQDRLQEIALRRRQLLTFAVLIAIHERSPRTNSRAIEASAEAGLEWKGMSEIGPSAQANIHAGGSAPRRRCAQLQQSYTIGTYRFGLSFGGVTQCGLDRWLSGMRLTSACWPSQLSWRRHRMRARERLRPTTTRRRRRSNTSSSSSARTEASTISSARMCRGLASRS